LKNGVCATCTPCSKKAKGAFSAFVDQITVISVSQMRRREIFVNSTPSAQRNYMTWIKRLSITVSIIAFVTLTLLYSYLYFMVGNDPFDDNKFDQQLWASMHESVDPKNPRGKMYQDLIENHVKIGMTKAQILNLLGSADLNNQERFIRYNLGMWSGMRVDNDSFDLYFSESGKLTKTKKVQH
jgi:hypothetical protein